MQEVVEQGSRPAEPIVYSFGDPESVLDRRELFDLFEVAHNGRWFEPAVPMTMLGKTYRMVSHHQSAIILKRNLLVGSFKPSRWLSRSTPATPSRRNGTSASW